MANLLLLCHGEEKELSNFQVPRGSTLQYRGNYGTNLDPNVAATIINAIRDNPYVTDEQLAITLQNYQPQDPIDDNTVRQPDFFLWGTNELPGILLNLDTRERITIDRTFARTTLGRFMATLKEPFWLNLLCCSEIPDVSVPTIGVDNWKVVKYPGDLFQ